MARPDMQAAGCSDFTKGGAPRLPRGTHRGHPEGTEEVNGLRHGLTHVFRLDTAQQPLLNLFLCNKRGILALGARPYLERAVQRGAAEPLDPHSGTSAHSSWTTETAVETAVAPKPP